MGNPASLLGIVVLIGLAWLFSENRRRFPLRVVAWGLALQAAAGLFLLRSSLGRRLFDGFHQAVTRFIGFATDGTTLVFGPLARNDLLAGQFGPANGMVLAITITGTIILVSSVSALLYHFGILQAVVRGMAWGMRRILGTSGSETLAAAANVFMGQTEAPLVIRPYLEGMTRSELMALMVGGMATIAGGVLAAYVGLGIDAGHLLTASVLSAPASLMMAKILVPETETSPTAAGGVAATERNTVNPLDALCHGAADGLRLSLNVLAMLIAFTAGIAATNWALAGIVGLVGWQTDRPLQAILGRLNAPFAWLIGIPWEDCPAVGTALGERILLNEFIGYLSLTEMQDTLQPRSRILATYALCGFANLASVAIQIGGISALAPGRRSDLARLGLRAMTGGLLACYLTACMAGLLLGSDAR